MNKHHPRRIGSRARIENISISIHLQDWQTGNETCDPQGRYSPARCENVNSPCSPALPGEDRSQSRIMNPLINLQLHPKSGGPPGRFRPVRWRNPNPTTCLPNTILGFTDTKEMKTTTPRVDTAPQAVETPTPLAHLRSPERIGPIPASWFVRYIFTAIKRGGGPQGRCRPVGWGNPNPIDCLLNPNLGFVEPVPPGKDKI